MAALMGIDIGTGSVKVELTDDTGQTWSASSASYSISSLHAGWAEQDPQTWWIAAQEVVADVWGEAGLGDDCEVNVGFTGQMHTTVLLDSEDQPVRPAILWCDSRAHAEAKQFGEQLPSMADITGNSPLPAFTLSHLLWLRRYEPDALDRARSLLLPKDYLRKRLTGIGATDWTDASGTNMLDVRTRTWSSEVMDASGLPIELLPQVLPSHEVIGPIYNLLPDRVRAVAVTGLGDVFAEAVGAGVVESGPLIVVLGTSGALLGVRDTPSTGVFCHAPADRWLRVDSLHSAGMSLTWLRDIVAPGLSLEDLTAEAESVPAGSEGLFFLPYLAGDRSSDGGSARAGFLGAQARHTRAHFVRAVLEGVTMELKRIASSRMGVPHPASIVLKGGGAKSKLWAKIVANVFAAPLSVSTRSAAGGALDVAGVGTQWWTYAEAAARAVHDTQEPSTDEMRVYAEHFDRYVEVVRSVHPD